MNGLPTEGRAFPDKTTFVEVMNVSSLGQGWTTSIFSILLCVCVFFFFFKVSFNGSC